MKYLHLFLVLMLLPLLLAAQDVNKPLPVDEAYRVGKLDNGLTYYIRHNEYPKNQCCFYIAQKVGSMQEEENQRGLAHLLEHMAFNGTQHFPGGRLIKFLEENGIKFGAELNAYTSLEETVYNIDNVPTDKGEALLDSCLQILADWSGGVMLEDEEIDKERGVVKSEYLMRNSPRQRMTDSIMPIVMSDSKYAHRMPIGLMSVVEGCPYDDLRAYYKKWYHPHYQGIVVVGDIDVDKMEQKIKTMFSDFRSPENFAKIVPCAIPDNDKPIFAFAADKEQKNTDLNIYFKFEKFPQSEKNTKAYFVYDMMTAMAYYMSYYRLSEYAKNPESPLLGAVAGITDFVYAKTKGAAVFIGQAKPGKELEAYKALLREAVRIGKYGFSQQELDRVKAELISEYEASYMERDKQKNSFYVEECINSFLHNDYMMSAEDEFEMAKQCMETIPLDAVNAFVKNIIHDNGKNLVAYNFSPVADGQFYFSNEIYQKATDDVLAEDIQPLEEKTNNKPLISKLLKPGTIVSRSTNDLLGARILKLSNGATVVTKQTDYKDDEILFYAQSFGGTSLYDVSDIRNLKYLDHIMSGVGFGSFSATDIQKMSAGKQAYVRASVSLKEECLTGNSVKKDLGYMMELVYSYFTQPGRSEADFENIRQQILQSIKTKELDPRNTLSDSIKAIRYNHNPRNMDISAKDVEAMDFKRIQTIFKERFANAGNFTFFFVGSFDEAELDALICKYIASLPKNKKTMNETFRPHQLEFNDKYVFCCTEREMATPESRVSKYYTRKDVDYSLSNMITFRILSEIMTSRQFKTIREDASIAYNTRCYMYLEHSETKGKADLTLNGFTPVKPEYAAAANTMMDTIMRNAQAEGFQQAELDKVRSFLQKNHEENLRNNHYWLQQMERYIIYGVDFVSGFSDVLNSITTKSLQESLNDFLDHSFSHTYILLPEGVEQKEDLD